MLVARILRLDGVKRAHAGSILFAISLGSTVLFSVASPLGRLMVVSGAFLITFLSFHLQMVDWLRNRDEVLRALKSMSATRSHVARSAIWAISVAMALGGGLGAALGWGLLFSSSLFAEFSIAVDAFPLPVAFVAMPAFAGGLSGLLSGVVKGWPS